jgi:hypothetical protein
MDASGEQSEKATRRATGEPPAELLARLDDPVAERTEWTPLVRLGTHLRTHRLVQDSVSRWSMRPTLSGRLPSGLMCLLLVAIGGMLLVGGVMGLRNPGAVLSQSAWAGLLYLGLGVCGFYVASAGIRQYRWVCQPRVFDLQANRYWRGKRPSDFGTPEADANAAPLDQVHAVQILGELVRGTKATDFRDFHSYEINLVLKDGRRINVVDHGSLEHIRKDAEAIGGLLGVPVWDATA